MKTNIMISVLSVFGILLGLVWLTMLHTIPPEIQKCSETTGDMISLPTNEVQNNG